MLPSNELFTGRVYCLYGHIHFVSGHLSLLSATRIETTFVVTQGTVLLFSMKFRKFTLLFSDITKSFDLRPSVSYPVLWSRKRFLGPIFLFIVVTRSPDYSVTVVPERTTWGHIGWLTKLFWMNPLRCQHLTV